MRVQSRQLAVVIDGTGRTLMIKKKKEFHRRAAAAAVRTVVTIAFATVVLAVAPEMESQPTTKAAASDAVSVEAVSSTPPWVSGDYLYDGSGNVKSIGAERYTYDVVGRLKSATVGAGRTDAKTQRYEYDGFGNLKVIEVVGGARRELPVDSTTNRLRSTGAFSATYDGAGNQVTENGGPLRTFDAFNSMTVGPNGTEYLYDANDERIAIINSARTDWRWTVRDVNARAVREFREVETTGGSMAWSWSKDYVYRGGSLVGAYVAENGTISRAHYHLDHLGTPRLVTDGTAVGRLEVSDYPFGEEVVQAAGRTDNTETRRFTGHERDYYGVSPGYLDYMHARYYSAITGRFLSVDPVLDVKRALRDPQQWNRYSYVSNSPLSRTDPDGRQAAAAAPSVPNGVPHPIMLAPAYHELMMRTNPSYRAAVLDMRGTGQNFVKAWSDMTKFTALLAAVAVRRQMQESRGVIIGESMGRVFSGAIQTRRSPLAVPPGGDMTMASLVALGGVVGAGVPVYDVGFDPTRGADRSEAYLAERQHMLDTGHVLVPTPEIISIHGVPTVVMQWKKGGD
jgi:RHS repeat-associated protein